MFCKRGIVEFAITIHKRVLWWVTEIVQLVPGEILLPLLYWLVSIWENRNHIWYFFLFFFFFTYGVTYRKVFIHWLSYKVLGELEERKKPPWCHLEIIQHGKELSIVLRAAGLGVDVIPEPLCAALYCSQAKKSKLACLLLTLLGLVPDAAESWSSSVAH